MTKRGLVLILISSIFGSFIWAQTPGYISQVDRVYDNIPVKCRISSVSFSDTIVILECPDLLKGESMPLRYHFSDGKIDDIGLAVFDISQIEIDREIMFFIERVLSEIITTDNIASVAKRFAENKVEVTFQSISMQDEASILPKNLLGFPLNIEDIKISRDELNYEVGLTNKELSKIHLRFPAEIQVVSGKDKVELDRALEYQFQNFTNDFVESIWIARKVDENVLIPYRRDIYRITGPQFADLIYPDIYLKKTRGNYQFVNEKSSPKESLANLMLAPSSIYKAIALDWKMYGESGGIVELELSNFVAYFQGDEFRNYIGFEKAKGDKIAATVIYFNHKLNYLHLLHIQTSTKDLFNSNVVLKGEFFTYIPTHNVKDLFKTYELDESNRFSTE